MPGSVGWFAHTLLANTFWTNLSLMPAGMTGNTKYFNRISDWPREPAASTTSRYLGSQFLNLKDILSESAPVASQPRGKPNLQAPRSLCSEWYGGQNGPAHNSSPFSYSTYSKAYFTQPSPHCLSARCTVGGKGPGAVDSIGIAHHLRNGGHDVQWLGT